jgi:hypothetical protein
MTTIRVKKVWEKIKPKLQEKIRRHTTLRASQSRKC